MYSFVLTKHAAITVSQRAIELNWIERALRYPVLLELDERDPSLSHALAPIVENGNRVLRVIFDKDDVPFRVVTAFFDRAMRNKL